MTRSSYAKKLLSIVLSLTMLLSCMVWSGVSAAQQTLSTDFTGYSGEAVNASNMDQFNGSKAQLVNTGVAAHGQAMKLYYEAGATSAKAGFRFFANTGAKFQYNQNTPNTYTKVTFAYQVQKLNGSANINVIGGFVNWSGEAFNSNQALGSDNHKTAVTLSATATPGTWQTASVVVGSHSAQNSAIHIYLQAANAANEAGSSVYIDDVTIITEYDPANDPDATYSFPIDDLTKAELIGNGSGKVVKTGAEYDHSGSATGKGMYMKMNQPYTASDYRNAARFWLENANGYLKGHVGAKYVVTAWVKSMRTVADDFYWAIGTYNSTNPNDDNSPRNYQEVTFASTKVTLQPGVWTKVTATINSLVGSGGSNHYMTFAGGFAAAHDGEYVYVDDITIEEFLPDTPVELPPAQAVVPEGTLKGLQTFESGAITDFTVDKDAAQGRVPFISAEANYTANGQKSLAVTLQKGKGNNGIVSRPRLAVKLGDAANVSNYTVTPGKGYNLSFWVRSTQKTTSFTYYVSTMTDPAHQMSLGSSGLGNPYRTIQTSTSNIGTKGNSQGGNEFSAITLEANQWTQIIVNIPELKAHGTDANAPQYLVIHYGDTGAYGDNGSFTTRTFFVDDVSLYEIANQGTVNYDTMGGDTLAPTVGELNSQVNLAVPYRIGYAFKGWYTAATGGTLVTSPYTLSQKEVTLYASWEKSEPERVTLTQDFEGVNAIEDLKTNTQKPFALTTEKNHTSGGSKALKASVTRHGYNGNFARPMWAFQANGETAPVQIIPGMPATVTFSLMATRDVGTVSLMLSTVNDLSVLSQNPGSSSAANSIRQMQVISSSTHGKPVKGGKSSAWGEANEINQVNLTANEWTTVTLEVASLEAFKTGAQYLVLVAGDSSAYEENVGFTNYDLYVDDVKLETMTGGHTVNVTYNTMGGDPMEDGTGIVWTDINTVANRKGYVFDGWFTDETCSTPITTYPPQESVTLYAGWRTADAELMHFEVDPNYVPTSYATMELEVDAVKTYASLNNMANYGAASYSIMDATDEPARGRIIKAVYGPNANLNTITYGFRLVGKENTSGFATQKGTCYSVTFKYKVEALPVNTEIRVLEGSINWNGPAFNSRVDNSGVKLTAADVGAGWQTGTINFESSLGSMGVHLALHAADYSQRAGTVVYFDDIAIRSFQMDDFTLSASATHVSGKNHTKGGNYALKIDNSAANGDIAKIGRVVYASGIGNKKLATDTINTASAWLYSEVDTSVMLGIFSEPDLTKMDTLTINQMVGHSDPVNLKAGQWTRVQVEFALPSLNGETETYVTVALEAGNHGHVIYMDDVSVGMYKSDSSVMQTYEELESGTHPNAPIFNGKLHGLNGNTVVTNKGYDGSKQSLEISMQGETEADASRAVLFFDKKDATAAVNGGYIVTFYAMTEEDLEVTFGLGTSGTIDLSDLANQATLHEPEATSKVSLTAGKWQGVSVYVSDLQGRNPEMCTDPYLTLGAWFAGAAADNVKKVYIDNVSLRPYGGSSAAKEDILCFEDTDAFGFGKDLNLSTYGKSEVVLEQNHTANGYYSLKMNTQGLNAISGATRPQFNLMNANGDFVRVEKGKTYRVSFWVNIAEESLKENLRYWFTVTEKTDSYDNSTNQQRKDEQIYEASNWNGKKGEWVQITHTFEDMPRDGYLRLGICGNDNGEKTTFYLDDIRVIEYKVFEFTGEETVEDYEKNNLEDVPYIRRGTAYVSDEANHTAGGANSLRMKAIGNSGAGRNQMILTNPATQQPYEFEIGKSYILNFWVYCPEEYTDNFELNTWLWGTDDVNLAFTQSNHKNDKNGTFEFDGGLAPANEDMSWVPGEWNKYTVSFTAKNGKYMLWGMTDGSRVDGNYVFYLDDVEIVIPKPATVTFDPNGGTFQEGLVELNDKGQFVENGFVGVLLNGPGADPYLEGKKFDGWAYDKEGTKLFDIGADTPAEQELTLYAVWGEWTNDDGYGKLENPGDKDDKDEIKYKTEIQYEKVWTGNATIPVLEAGDRPTLEDADPVTYTPPVDTDTDANGNGLPVWLIIVIIVAAVVVVGGGAFLALLLLKNKKSDDEKEVNA